MTNVRCVTIEKRMSERPPRGFTEDTNATPLIRLADASAIGPKRPCLVMIAGPRLGEIFPIEHELVIGRDPDCVLRLADDEGVSRQHARVKSVVDGGALITDLGSANGTYVDGERITERVLKEGSKIRVGQTVVLKYASYDAIEELAQRQLLEAALRDGLTKAFNRRYFMQRLTAEIRFAERHASTVALVMLDIDHFKALNDRLGHPAGDDVLKKLVDILTETLRAEDVLARYGGEEFAVLTRGITREHAFGLADRLRKLVAATPFGTAGEVTVSVGVAVFPFPEKSDDPAQKLVELADAALYRAKQAGRNQVQS
jgi:two-component system, cell cycle response regulator